MTATARPVLNRETYEPNESETARRLVALLSDVIEQHYFTGLTFRDVHVKGHAAVEAEFVIDPELPREFRIGLFKEPKAYRAWIRFSNASHIPSPDIKGDIRGFALKLLGVPGRKLLGPQEDADTQDFIFLSTNVFLTSTADDFRKFVAAGALNYKWTFWDLLKIGWFVLTHPKVGFGLIANSKKFPNLLEMEWFSAVPYLLGERAVKYKLRPHRKPVSRLPQDAKHNYLRERLAEDLARDGTAFDFMIQFQQDPERQPIEDALVPWKESEAPFRKFATLHIPKQKIDTPERMSFAENLSMNPWHCLPEHRPIGGINRVRRDVYFAISQFRHHRNGVPVQEPT